MNQTGVVTMAKQKGGVIYDSATDRRGGLWPIVLPSSSRRSRVCVIAGQMHVISGCKTQRGGAVTMNLHSLSRIVLSNESLMTILISDSAHNGMS